MISFFEARGTRLHVVGTSYAKAPAFLGIPMCRSAISLISLSKGTLCVPATLLCTRFLFE